MKKSSLEIGEHSLSGTGVDASKRQTLRILGGTVVLATASSAAFSDENSDANLSQHEVTSLGKNQNVALNSASELSISLTLEPVPTLSITNKSDELIALRHVYPGIVHAGQQSFDINEAFADDVCVIDAGQTCFMNIHPIKSTDPETNFPRHLYSKQPLRVASVTGADSRGPLINSTRSFYS